MDEARFFPKKVYVTKDSENSPITQRVLENTPHIPVEFISDSRELIADITVSRDPVGKGKELLLITLQQGEYVKPCPCTPKYIGCNYFIINADTNCPLDCSYCILQLYLENPLITVHANTALLYRQLDNFLRKNRNRTFRIGTGELGDSLALDHLTGRSNELMSYFAGHPNALFELKTKTVNIKNVLEHKPPDNIVVAWSLNSHQIAREEEIGAPPVHDRIKAASKISQAGYRVGFHFDPLILYEGWKDGYAEVIDELISAIDRKKIAWISLGSLRFPPALKSVIHTRFTKTQILCEEFITGKDGKLRYPKPLRLRLFKHVYDLLIKTGGKKFPIYFCMESGDVWKEVQKKTPRSKKEVERLLS
jgi:spore photoproduct lyase